MKFLKELSLLQSVSGEEQIMFEFIIKILKEHDISYSRLPHGDILVGKKEPNCLFTAHVDEVGFKVKKILKNGSLQIEDVGWVYPWLFPGREVQVQTKDGRIHYGIVVYDKAFDKQIRDWKNIRVDLGFDSQEEIKKAGITTDCFGTYKKDYWETDSRVFASALDNRLSVALLLNFIIKNKHRLEKMNAAFAFTSDEEMENVGAKKTIPMVNPKHICVVDIMPHSLLDNGKAVNIQDGPYVLTKTLDYQLPPTWKKILSGISYKQLRGKSKFLKNSEPKIFQRMGYHESINLLAIMYNYHHGVYACHKASIRKTKDAIEYIAKNF